MGSVALGHPIFMPLPAQTEAVVKKNASILSSLKLQKVVYVKSGTLFFQLLLPIAI